MLSNIEKCQLLAVVAHKGQKDKGGSPYILHPWKVAHNVETDEEKCVAWLHDVLEDSEFTSKDLMCLGLPEDVVEAVVAITKKQDENYDEYISRVKENTLARSVKLEDLKHNMDIARWKPASEMTEKDKKRQRKYEKAFAYLSL